MSDSWALSGFCERKDKKERIERRVVVDSQGAQGWWKRFEV